MRRQRDPEARRARRGVANAGDVLEAAARSLGGAPRSKVALTERLIAAGYATELVLAAVERLEAIGLIDDERLAAALIESRDRSRQRGDRALLHELQQRGIPKEIAERLLDERANPTEGAAERSARHGGGYNADDRVSDGAQYGAEERAARAAMAKMPPRGDNPRKEAQRVAQALARRGFPPPLCWALGREFVTMHAAALANVLDDDEEA